MSICALETNQAHNVIPESVTLKGTMRFHTDETRDLLDRRIDEICAGMAIAFGVDIEVIRGAGCPPCVNGADQHDAVVQVAETLIGREQVMTDFAPVMGAEDFAFFAAERPSGYFGLGQAGGYAAHHPKYQFNDEVIPLGVAMFCEIVRARSRALAALSNA